MKNEKKVMFRVNVDKEEKMLIKKKADKLALSVGSYAKMILKVLNGEQLGIMKDERPIGHRDKPLCIMIELSREQSNEIASLAVKEGVYKSEWFRWVLLNIDATLKLKL